MCNHHSLFSSALTALAFSPSDLTTRKDQFANEFANEDFAGFFLRSMVIEAHKIPGGLESLGEDLT